MCIKSVLYKVVDTITQKSQMVIVTGYMASHKNIVYHKESIYIDFRGIIAKHP